MGSTQSTEIESCDIPNTIKIGVYGDGAVGKTQLIQRACYNKFYRENEWTVVDDDTLNITIHNKQITLHILDTGGSYGIEFIDADWFKQCDAHLLCFDPCRRITFDVVIILYQKLINIKNQQFEEENKNKKKFVLDPVGLVCTKCEDERFNYKQREVQESEAVKFANENNMLYIECSAKNNKNCQLCFELIAKEAIKPFVWDKKNTKKHVNIHKAKLITDPDHDNLYQNYSDTLIPPNMNLPKLKLKQNYSNPLKTTSKLKLRDTKSNEDRSLYKRKRKKKNIKKSRALPNHRSVSLKQLRQMILFGFVRIKCKMNPENIPQDVISICDRFYARSDEWDINISDPRLIHSKEQRVIDKPSSCRVITKFYGFGAAIVQYGQTRKWIFEITKRDNNYSRVSINIGIIDRDILYGKYFNFAVNNDFVYDNSSIKLSAKNGKVWDGYNVKSYCKPLQIGDIVEMELDMKRKNGYIEGINKQGNLRYIINSIDQGIAFNNIDVTKYYSLYVAFERNDSMKMITNFDR